MEKLMVGLTHVLPLCAVLLVLPALAAAQGNVTLQPDRGPVGMEVRAIGAGWSASTTVEIYFGSQFLGEAVKADAYGAFTTTFIVPDRPPALYPVSFTDGRANFAPPFTITGPGQGSTCKPAFFIGVRGTGEPATKGWLGDTVWPFYDKFKAAYGKTNIDLHGVPYPAISPNLTISCDLTGCNLAQLPDKLTTVIQQNNPGFSHWL